MLTNIEKNSSSAKNMTSNQIFNTWNVLHLNSTEILFVMYWFETYQLQSSLQMEDTILIVIATCVHSNIK